jgi:branched-chain amino acid transport system ATP-binding protein
MTDVDRAEDVVDGLPPVLAVADVSVRFGGVKALTDVALTVGRGEVVGVIGPNGAGKTTLFDVIAGLRRPSEGRVHLDGVDVTGRSAAHRARRGVRRTFQRQQVFGALSVHENLLVAQESTGMPGGVVVDVLGLSGRRPTSAAHVARADEVLTACGLDAVRSTPAGALPIGQARMVELGRALVEPPRLLLLDEPTSGLGEAESAALSAVLRSQLAGGDGGVLLVEHDVAFVMDHCDRVVVLDLGRVIADGTPDEVRADPTVRTAYLG